MKYYVDDIDINFDTDNDYSKIACEYEFDENTEKLNINIYVTCIWYNLDDFEITFKGNITLDTSEMKFGKNIVRVPIGNMHFTYDDCCVTPDNIDDCVRILEFSRNSCSAGDFELNTLEAFLENNDEIRKLFITLLDKVNTESEDAENLEYDKSSISSILACAENYWLHELCEELIETFKETDKQLADNFFNHIIKYTKTHFNPTTGDGLLDYDDYADITVWIN